MTGWRILFIIISVQIKKASTVNLDRYYLRGKYYDTELHRKRKFLRIPVFAYTLSLISGKHKMVILYCLMEFQPVRFNELKRYLKTISDKTLSTNLKELEVDRLIIRTEYPQIPPKVEYSLSERGKSLMAVLDQLCLWGEKNRLYD